MSAFLQPPEPFKLGDDVFTVSPLPGEESFLLQPRILPLGVELGALAVAQAESGDSLVSMIDKIGPVVTRACAKLPPEELKFIMRALLRGATMNGKLLYSSTGEGHLINVLMMGRTLDMWKLLAKALEVSYPDFFALARGLRARVAVKATPSETSTTSGPGPAGDS